MKSPVIEAPKEFIAGKHTARALPLDDGEWVGVIFHANEGHIPSLVEQYGNDSNPRLLDPAYNMSVSTTTLSHKHKAEENALRHAEIHAKALNDISDLING